MRHQLMDVVNNTNKSLHFYFSVCHSVISHPHESYLDNNILPRKSIYNTLLSWNMKKN
jgi:hypothetical protein